MHSEICSQICILLKSDKDTSELPNFGDNPEFKLSQGPFEKPKKTEIEKPNLGEFVKQILLPKKALVKKTAQKSKADNTSNFQKLLLLKF